MAAWWNGRHSRLKICFWETGVPVRVRPRPPTVRDVIPSQMSKPNDIAVRRPMHAEIAIVLCKPLQQIRRLVILGCLLDLSPVGAALHVGPRQIAKRLLARGNGAMRRDAVEIERRLARAGLLFAN